MLAGFFVVGLKGKELTQETLEFAREYKPFGFIIFSKNVEDQNQLKEFLYSLKAQSGYNPVFFIDQEGGRVIRCPPPFDFPSAREIGRMWERKQIGADEVWELGVKVASHLKSLGIDVNLAPVVDLWGQNFEVIDDRAYSPDPETVGEIASAFAQGLRSAGVLAVAKHFPGHGAVKGDSHKVLPVVPEGTDIQRHILPFRKVTPYVFGIMTAHIVVKDIDDKPATFSRKVISMAREFFSGCIMTDDLLMGALEGWDVAERCKLAFEAGCDLLLLCTDDYNFLADVFKEFFDYLKTVPESRKLDSAQRLSFLRFKRVFKGK